jgi:hypothetical protein
MATVSFELDLDNPPTLTDEQRARLDELAAMPDSEIDFSDIPKATEEQLARMRPFREVLAEFRARQKQAATV